MGMILLKHWKLAAILALASSLYFIGDQLVKERKERKRVQQNFEILQTDSDQALSLTKKELKTEIEQDQTLIKLLQDSLKIKTKDIESLKKASSKTEIQYKTVLKDTIIYEHDTVVVKEYFAYNDPWTTATAIILDDSVDFTYTSYDTLVVVNHKFKNRKWFLTKLFEPWKVKTSIENVNPNNNIVIDKTIVVVD
jgi:seryl-tRNA synthetase